MTENQVGELPFLLIGSFRAVIDELHEHLRSLGYDDVRPLHGFALQSISDGGVSITEFSHRLGVTKQAAAKTVASMEQLGLVQRHPDQTDSRATNVTRTERADNVLRESGRFFARKEREWRDAFGADRFENLLAALQELTSPAPETSIPGWLGRATRT